MYLHSMRTFEGSERKQSLSSSYPKYLYTNCINVGGVYNRFIKWTKEADIIEIPAYKTVHVVQNKCPLIVTHKALSFHVCGKKQQQLNNQFCIIVLKVRIGKKI